MHSTQTVIETERLILRAFNVTDARSFYELNNAPNVMLHTGDVPFESEEDSRLFIENYDAYRLTGFGRWTVLLKSTGAIIGWCGLKKHPSGMIDLGYRLHEQYWNKGYATEAAKACVEYGFETLSLDEIVGRTAQENPNSIRVLEKIGMTFWKNAPCEGIENSVYYKICRKDNSF